MLFRSLVSNQKKLSCSTLTDAGATQPTCENLPSYLTKGVLPELPWSYHISVVFAPNRYSSRLFEMTAIKISLLPAFAA